MRLKIEYISINDIKPDKLNPRSHSEIQIQQIAKSIQEFGFNVPIIIDENKQILAGHGRYEASQQIGIKEIPTVLVKNLNEAQKKAFLIADNQIATNSKWNDELLDLNLSLLKELDFDLDILGWIHGVPEFDESPDYEILKDESIQQQADELSLQFKKSIQIEFEQDDVDEARELIKYWRNNTADIGKFLIKLMKDAKR